MTRQCLSFCSCNINPSIISKQKNGKVLTKIQNQPKKKTGSINFFKTMLTFKRIGVLRSAHKHGRSLFFFTIIRLSIDSAFYNILISYRKINTFSKEKEYTKIS